MTQAFVETICSKCGAEIREGALYCYGCGGAVAETAVASDGQVDAGPSADLTDLEIAHSSAAVQSSRTERGARRRMKPAEAKVVEVAWEEPTNGTSGFIIASLILAVLGFLLVAVGLYLK